MVLEHEGVTSVLVARGREIVVESYYEGDAETLRDTRSCTKTVLGMLVGIAVEYGVIDGVETRVLPLLKDRSPRVHVDPRKTEITVEQLLTMSSPLECDDWNPSSAGNEERMYPCEDWPQFALDLPLRRTWGFSYCTAGVVLLGVALEEAVGERLASFAARVLFPAVGIERFDWPATPLGESSAAGGLLLASRSLLELGRLYLEGGRGAVSEAWVERSTRLHARVDERTGYGYLWWLRSFAEHRSFFMSGLGGNRVHVFPDLDLVIVVTTTNFGVRGAHDLTDELLVDLVLRYRN
jgi:CubicO group peptidase (beta-lactamase class C family)